MNAQNITHEQVIAARRTIIRIFRNEMSTFGIKHLNYQYFQWATAFCNYHFKNAIGCYERWHRSPHFEQWVMEEYDLRNVQILLDNGYDLHFIGKMGPKEYATFIELYTSYHKQALAKEYPPKSIIHLISNQSNY